MIPHGNFDRKMAPRQKRVDTVIRQFLVLAGGGGLVASGTTVLYVELQYLLQKPFSTIQYCNSYRLTIERIIVILNEWLYNTYTLYIQLLQNGTFFSANIADIFASPTENAQAIILQEKFGQSCVFFVSALIFALANCKLIN